MTARFVTGRFVATAAQMRGAEDRVMAAGTDVHDLMRRAGQAVAEVAKRFTGGCETLVVCGPGNNGGDGYVAVEALRRAGITVRVTAFAEPRTPAAIEARRRWSGPVEAWRDARPAPLLIDALFGTGLKTGLQDADAQRLLHLAEAANASIAVDLPSGTSADDGKFLWDVPRFDVTVALGAMKPAHLLYPAAGHMGRLVVADIGVPVESSLVVLERPGLSSPGASDHKYTRGLVAVVAGDMPGAARLAALGAARAGAGYVQVVGRDPGRLPAALVVREGWGGLDDERIDAIIVGPGLGRGAGAGALLDMALASGRPLVIDADGLKHLGDRRVGSPAILTPHEGEFATAFGDVGGNKVERAREAARRTGAVVVLKGPDTVVASPDGRAAITDAASFDLATAGTGDVLAGVCGAMLAQLHDPFAAACAAVWLHGAAARSLAGPFVADDLAAALPAQVRGCR